MLINYPSAPVRTELVLHHAQMNIEYGILCSKIASDLTAKKNETECIDQIRTALKMAELLENIYGQYLNCPREKNRLKKEREALRNWIENGPSPKDVAPAPQKYVSKTIREETPTFNLPRLFLVRVKRLLLAIEKLTDASSSYSQNIKKFDKNYAAPILGKLSWLIFLPRITINLAMMLKHTVAHPWMSNEEKALGAFKRFQIQWDARWNNLSNDIPWCIANYASVAVFTGSLQPYGIILSILMQIYEVAQAWMVWHREIKNLKEQRVAYSLLRTAASKNPNGAAYKEANDYIEHLDKRIHYDNKRLFIPTLNTLVLLIAILLSAPIFSPGYAVLGGIIAVSTTIISYRAGKQHEKTKPPNGLFELLKTPRNRFFPSDTPLTRTLSGSNTYLPNWGERSNENLSPT